MDPTTYGYPEWLTQLGSFREDRATTLWEANEGTHGHPTALQRFYLEHRVAEPVQCKTMAALVAEHGFEECDLLSIDTEGYDYEILKSIDFDQWHPRMVNYERALLGADEPKCRALMRSAGYRLIDWQVDTFCVRR